MEASSPTQPDDERQRAPEHVIDMLAGVMRQPAVTPASPAPDSVAYARRARAEAQIYADRIWAEAFHAGAAWGLARNNQPILVAPDVIDRLTEEAG